MEIVLSSSNHWRETALAAIHNHMTARGVDPIKRDRLLSRMMEKWPYGGDTISMPCIKMDLVFVGPHFGPIKEVRDANTGELVFEGNPLKRRGF